MPGDDKSEPPPPPPTMEGLAALMTKLLSSMADMEMRMETRITSMESHLQPPLTSTPAASMPYRMPGYGSTTLASSSSTAAATLSTAPPTSSPTSSAPFSYGMPGYGSTSLGSPSFTAAATMATAAFPSFTAPSPVPGSAADVRLPKTRASPAAIVPSFTKDLCADIRVTIVQIQTPLQEMIQLERKREAVVHLQAATRKFLARRLVRVMRKEQQDQAASFIKAAVRLQAAARRLLARRRLQKMRLEMQEAALTAIDLGNWGRDLVPS
ncbi:uncharacterized protein LOC120702092 [Panicum virgatum]|uniref:uncharacterized protein LOC120702092 n=1 Tax=Panicum virgatum TaxID=38727 RepID=UPI0019D5D48C|nr:uncharacterized protein LOC120702092 [Panicum virgatum]